MHSFGSSGPTAWNDMPAHLHNLDLSLTLDNCWKPLCYRLFRCSYRACHCDS